MFQMIKQVIADEDLSDDVIGDTNGTYYYYKMTDTMELWNNISKSSSSW